MRSRVRQLFLLGLFASPLGEAQEPAAWPPPLSSHVMVYVPTLSRVVVFGGSNPAREMSSTLWSWDGSSWVAQTHDENGPAPRIHAGVAYDSARDRLVVFGGIGADASTLGDVWEWDGERWIQITTDSSWPGARDHHALAYDPVVRRIILYGGQDDQDRFRSDTWSWDGSAWTELVGEGDGSGPPGRGTHRLATDAEGRRVLLFGGWDESGLLNDLWEWNGRVWNAIDISGPPPTGATRYAFDEEHHALVMFGGRVNEASVADTWVLEGNLWRHIAVTGDGSEARNVHAMAYDAKRRRIVLYGGIGNEGRLDDLWEWDSTGASWSRVRPPN